MKMIIRRTPWFGVQVTCKIVAGEAVVKAVKQINGPAIPADAIGRTFKSRAELHSYFIKNWRIHMINLTPHAITVRVNGVDTTIQPSGTLARVTSSEQVVGVCPLSGAPIIRRVFGEATGLPENGEPCLVSALVLSACPNRAGVFAPDTGPTAIRNDAGQVVAVTRLVAA